MDRGRDAHQTAGGVDRDCPPPRRRAHRTDGLVRVCDIREVTVIAKGYKRTSDRGVDEPATRRRCLGCDGERRGEQRAHHGGATGATGQAHELRVGSEPAVRTVRLAQLVGDTGDRARQSGWLCDGDNRRRPQRLELCDRDRPRDLENHEPPVVVTGGWATITGGDDVWGACVPPALSWRCR